MCQSKRRWLVEVVRTVHEELTDPRLFTLDEWAKMRREISVLWTDVAFGTKDTPTGPRSLMIIGSTIAALSMLVIAFLGTTMYLRLLK